MTGGTMDSAAAISELSTATGAAGHLEAATVGMGKDGLAEVGRFAIRLAAFERSVLPVAERRLDPGQTEPVREGVQQLTTVLHWLDRYLTGDVRAANWPGDDLSHDVEAAVTSYAELEGQLISELAETLDDADMTKLIRSYHEATQVAPTRPHPKLNYDGALGRLKFRAAGLIDDVRDGTESRPAGTMVGEDSAQSLRKLDTDAAGADGAGEPAAKNTHSDS